MTYSDALDRGVESKYSKGGVVLKGGGRDFIVESLDSTMERVTR